MATDKMFTLVGISTLNGETKVRFANDIMRIKVLAKHGHTDIRLVELSTEMSKVDAAKFLLELDEFKDSLAQEVILDFLDRNTSIPKAKKETKVISTKPKVKATKPVVSDEDEDDDRPFGYSELEAAVGEAMF